MAAELGEGILQGQVLTREGFGAMGITKHEKKKMKYRQEHQQTGKAHMESHTETSKNENGGKIFIILVCGYFISQLLLLLRTIDLEHPYGRLTILN